MKLTLHISQKQEYNYVYLLQTVTQNQLKVQRWNNRRNNGFIKSFINNGYNQQ